MQVEGIPGQVPIEQLRSGVDIRIKKKSYHTRPARVSLLSDPPLLPDRDPPVRYRKTVPDSWLEIALTEGKNRQVRRMCAAVGFPVLRLIRTRIEKLGLEDHSPGDVWEINQSKILKSLTISM